MQCMQCMFTIFSNGRIFCLVLNFTMLLSVYVTSVNKFAPTMGFCWSYTLLLKLPVLMRS